MHHLIYEIHQDILSVDNKIHTIHWHEEEGFHHDEDYYMEESPAFHYQEKTDFANLVKKPKKKKHGNRKPSVAAGPPTQPTTDT